MKTFDQLTEEQKRSALDFARDAIKLNPFLDFGAGDGLNEETVDYYAQEAVQNAFYSEKGDLVIDNILE